MLPAGPGACGLRHPRIPVQLRAERAQRSLQFMSASSKASSLRRIATGTISARDVNGPEPTGRPEPPVVAPGHDLPARWPTATEVLLDALNGDAAADPVSDPWTLAE